MAANSRFSMAVHLLTLLANAGEENLKSDYMACSVNTNPVVVRRLLCALGSAKFVSSQTGASGGSKLMRKPDEISLVDVFRAVETGGTSFALHRKRPSARCYVGKHIEAVLENLQDEVDNAVAAALGKYTLKDVMDAIARTQKGAKLKAKL